MRFYKAWDMAADDGVEQMAERDVVEGELDGHAPLGRHDPEPAALVLEADEDVVHPGAADEAVVQRLVVLAVDGHELVDAVGGERVHLRL